MIKILIQIDEYFHGVKVLSDHAGQPQTGMTWLDNEFPFGERKLRKEGAGRPPEGIAWLDNEKSSMCSYLQGLEDSIIINLR